MVNALGLTHEHDLQFLTGWIVVDVLGQLLVDIIVLIRNVHSDASLEVDDVLAELVDLALGIPNLSLHLLHLR